MSVFLSFFFGCVFAVLAFFALGHQKAPQVPTPHPIKPHSQRVLIPLPTVGFDTTEFAYPVSVLSSLGYDVIFATPTGQPSAADPLVLNSTLFRPAKNIIALYDELRSTPAFLAPFTFDEMQTIHFDGLMLIGGHHPGMSSYLDDARVHQIIRKSFAAKKIIGMICHGTLAALRTTALDDDSQAGESILSSLNASFTFLPSYLERVAHVVNSYIFRMENYQLSTTNGSYVEEEILRKMPHSTKGNSSLVHSPFDLLAPIFPGNSRDHSHAFVVWDDKNALLSARFWGDAYLFALCFAQKLQIAENANLAAAPLSIPQL